MFSFLFFAVLCTSCLADEVSTEHPMKDYSYSPSVGGGSGTSFSTAGDGRITAIRVWEQNNAFITGLQVRNGKIWSKIFGRIVGRVKEMELFDGETIVQVSGKYHNNYVYQMQFVTCKGRSMIVGQPLHLSFNFYPTHPDAELKLLSGRFTAAGITSVGAHWEVFMYQSNSTAIY